MPASLLPEEKGHLGGTAWPLNVIYGKECQERNILVHEPRCVRALTFGRTFALLPTVSSGRDGERLVKSRPGAWMILLCSWCVFYASI